MPLLQQNASPPAVVAAFRRLLLAWARGLVPLATTGRDVLQLRPALMCSTQKQEILFRQVLVNVSTNSELHQGLCNASVEHALDVQVHYTGTLEDGSVFDSSLEREPLEFEVGGGKVIPGFDDAVMGLAEGEKRKQLVPAERAYGKKHPMTAALRLNTCACTVHGHACALYLYL